MSTVFSRKRPVLGRMIKCNHKNVSVKAGVFVYETNEKTLTDIDMTDTEKISEKISTHLLTVLTKKLTYNCSKGNRIKKTNTHCIVRIG